MEPELLFKALGYLVIELLAVTLVIISGISAAKEQRSKGRLKGLVFFTLVVISLCTLMGLVAAYVQQAGPIK